jgi:hypothetical protein
MILIIFANFIVYNIELNSYIFGKKELDIKAEPGKLCFFL